MKHTLRMFLFFILLIALLIPLGCAYTIEEGGKAAVIATSEAFKHFSGEYENTGYFQKYKPKSIAVLPFKDLERKSYSIDFEEDDPAGVVRRGMYNHISSLPFTDLEIYEIDQRLKNAGLTDVRAVDQMIVENPEKLKSILGVDAVIQGDVTHFDRIFAGIYSQVAVGCEVRMWDLKNGELLWRAENVARAHAGGFSLSPVGLALATVAAVWNLKGTELLSQTDELFREIVSTIDIPESAYAGRIPPPKIDLFAVMNSQVPYTLGKKAAFRVIGDPGCSAYVDLGDFKSGIDLEPVSAGVKAALGAEVIAAIKANYSETGHELTPDLLAAVEKELASREIYEGHYVVGPGEEAYGLLAQAYLVNAAGGQAKMLDAVHIVDIDSLPPVQATGLSGESLDNKIILSWQPNSEEDLAGYEAWSSATPLSGYALVSKTEKTGVAIAGLPNFTQVYFQVRAIDRAGNAGHFSKPLEAVPLPEKGLYDLPRPGPVLGGAIAGKVLLTAEKNPFTVFSDIEVKAGSVLYLEPGVELQFAPDTALIVDGGDILAFGRTGLPIRFVSKTGSNGPGAWRGVFMKGAGKALLSGVWIDGADVGLSIKNSAPTVKGCRITGSAQAGLELGDGAKPSITCSEVRGNEGQGGMVIDGEDLAPVIRHNLFADNEPFQVQSYTILQIDLSENFWGVEKPTEDKFLGNVVLQPVLSKPPGPCPAGN
jgi:hypothetical protein